MCHLTYSPESDVPGRIWYEVAVEASFSVSLIPRPSMAILALPYVLPRFDRLSTALDTWALADETAADVADERPEANWFPRLWPAANALLS